MKSLWEFRFQNYKSRAENRKGSAAIKTTEPELLVRQVGFEPATPWFVARYSIQLSYRRTLFSALSSRDQHFTETLLKVQLPCR